MNHLQKFIQMKLSEGKSYRRMEKECGVNHNSLSDYHQHGTTPKHGKNLALLAKYFHCELEILLEPVTPKSDSYYFGNDRRHEKSPDLILIEQELSELSADELLEVRLELRKWLQARKLTS